MNFPTAAQPDCQDTSSPPLKVKPRDVYLGMQTQGLRYDRASVQRKNKETVE